MFHVEKKENFLSRFTYVPFLKSLGQYKTFSVAFTFRADSPLPPRSAKLCLCPQTRASLSENLKTGPFLPGWARFPF